MNIYPEKEQVSGDLFNRNDTQSGKAGYEEYI